jgi:hypothetical protein
MEKMIRSRFYHQRDAVPGASKFHEHVRQCILQDSFLNSLRCYQEVPVHAINPNYHSKAHRFDWYIEDLNLIVELHGDQHYKLTNRGNVGRAQAEHDFKQSQLRDSQKKIAAQDVELAYLEIPYKMKNKLTPETLRKMILECLA